MSRTTHSVAAFAAVLVTVAVFFVASSLFRSPEPHRHVARCAASLADPGPLAPTGDSSLADGALAPRIDPAALRQALADAGVSPEAVANGRADAREEALRLLRSAADPFAKRVAIFQLWNARQVDDAAIDAILAVLAEGPTDEGLVAQSLHAMKDSPRPDVAAATLTWLRTSPSPAVRMAAVKALHFRRGAEVTRALDEEVSSETDPEVARRALAALGSRALDDPAARGALETVRRSAVDPALRQLAEELAAEDDRVLETLAQK